MDSGIRGEAERALDRLYREVILDHFRSPRNKRTVEGENASAEGRNALCGDVVRIGLRMRGDRVEEAGFAGEGCALCMAAASMLADRLAGLDIREALKLIGDFSLFLRGEKGGDGTAEDALGDLAAFEGVFRFPVRLKCVLLPFEALEEAIRGRREAR